MITFNPVFRCKQCECMVIYDEIELEIEESDIDESMFTYHDWPMTVHDCQMGNKGVLEFAGLRRSILTK